MTYKHRISIILIILATFACYLNSLKAPFVLDDNARIVNNPDIRKLGNLKSKLIYPHQQKDNNYWKYWERNDPSRPVVFFTYTLNYFFNNLSPSGYHLFNIIFHILNAVLIYFLLFLFIQYTPDIYPEIIPIFTALLFAVHPLNVDAVTYTFGRSNILATSFYLLSLLLFMKSIQKNTILYPVSLVCFILSLFSKQIAVTLPLIILLADFIFISNYRIKEVVKRKLFHLPFWTILAAYLLFRHFYFGGIGDIEAYKTWDRNLYILVQPGVILSYLKMLLLPAGLSLVHIVKKPVTIFEFRIILSYISLFILFLLTYRAYRKRSDTSKIITFTALWFIITLLPTSSIFPTTQALVERRTYLPGIGIYTLIALVYYLLIQNLRVNRTSIKKYLILFIMSIHIITLGFLTYQRNHVFSDPILLWQKIAAKYPSNSEAHNNLGIAYMNREQYSKAYALFIKAIELKPASDLFHKNLGKLYFKLEKYNRAIKEFNIALNINRNNYRIYHDLGLAYYELKKYEKAMKYYKYSLKINPDFANAYNNIGALHFINKDLEKALNAYKKAIDLKPDYDEAYFNLALTYEKSDQLDKAVAGYNKAIRLGFNEITVYSNLGNIYYTQKKYTKAKKVYKAALKLDPDSEIIQRNLELINKKINNQSKLKN